MPSKPITLKGLAAKLGVHVSTVSRVLNGDPERVHEAASPELVERIRKLARQLEYLPNSQAVNLKTQQSKEIAVLMPSVSDIVQATAYEGIVSAATEEGYSAFAASTSDRPDRQLEFVKRALKMRVAGLILSDVHIRSKHPGLDLLQDYKIPFVLLYRRRGELTSVAVDDRLGGALVAEHFYSRGHRNIGILAGPKHASSSVGRVRGVLDFFRSKGVHVPDDTVIHSPFDATSGHAEGRRLLSAHPSLTAVFAVNDFLAIGLMGALREMGRRVGADIAVAGYNDIPISPYLPIPLTSVHVPMYDMGRQAVSLLLRRIAGETMSSVLITPTLRVRESSDLSKARSMSMMRAWALTSSPRPVHSIPTA